MSGQIAGQTRALPFTGLTALPFALLGVLLSAAGFLLTRLHPGRETR